MKHERLRERYNELKNVAIKDIRFLLGTSKLVLQEEPEMDYLDIDGSRIMGVSGQKITIHPNDGNDYSLSSAELIDLINILSLLETKNYKDFFIEHKV